jgi:hypothetical protein
MTELSSPRWKLVSLVLEAFSIALKLHCIKHFIVVLATAAAAKGSRSALGLDFLDDKPKKQKPFKVDQAVMLP